ncbi:MAG: 50S ribosomal protein L6 [Candidatus Cloacimonadaceae bacterium]|jgi:large subunit ribosomal protein L6|nr:50S ribosomal protein L6 [Candidatus Cloacimonadota bacterium]MCB5258635.1 50S ribosomal protein L6 [Candidatus Cloacimonadota bacterium]MDD5624261.1 50S ribosomal protein L6 [Candidatus Cloacimonadota bacterium]MDY0112107.1 50S ribosomal protein L6 [Candidatus Syntrophosphaera sp.]
MSRIGKAPIKFDQDTQIVVKDNIVSVKGKMGELHYQLMPGISVEILDGVLQVKRCNDSKEQKALHGLTRALLQNMVKGVSEGYQKNLLVIGTGYSAQRIGPWLKLSLGYSHDIIIEVPESLTVETEAVPRTKTSRSDIQSIIRVKGIDKQLVGEFAAEIRACRPPENYKGKGIRYENEHVIIKAGKAGTK